MVQSQSTVTADGDYNSFPWLATPNAGGAGNLIAIYRQGSSHISSASAIMMQTSSDGGATWSGKTNIAQAGASYDYRDPSVVRTRTGRLFVNSYSLVNGLTWNALFNIYSDDHGSTWTGPNVVSQGFTSFTQTSAACLQHSTGPLLWPVYGQNTGDTQQQAGVMSSTDDGATWSNPVSVGGANTNYTEMSLVEMPDHSIQAFIRQDQASGNNNILTSKSTDAGATWSAPTALPWLCTPGRPAAVIDNANGMLLLFYRQATSESVVFRYSDDFGATWREERQLTPLVYEYAGGMLLSNGNMGYLFAYDNGGGGSRADLSFIEFSFVTA